MNVIITGAHGALGQRVVKEFVERGDTTLVLAAGADLTGGEGVQELTRLVQTAKPLDALVHLAGGYDGGSRMEQTPQAVFDTMMKINFGAAVSAFQAVLPVMLQQGSGRIVAISAEAARVPTALVAAYAASKAALYSLVQSVNAENTGSGIRAEALTPLVLNTDTLRDRVAQEIFAFVHEATARDATL
jgi:short-subunit dehydrogenase